MEREHSERESKAVEKKERKLTKFNASRFTGKKRKEEKKGSDKDKE